MAPETPAGSCFPASYCFYQKLLASYGRSRSRLYRAAIERTVKAAVLWGQVHRGIAFPDTAVGGWWWTWRWRFEVLMEWNEAESVCWCRRLVRPGMTVVDVGAHIGYYTRLLASLVGPSGAVYAFEAHPENFALARRNLGERSGGHVHLFNLAAGDEPGRVRLHLSPGSSNHSLVSGYTEDRGTIEVECVTLDSFLAGCGVGAVDFVKIDVEGAEPRVLAGMSRLLAASPRAALLIELNPRALACGGSSAEDLLERIGSLGFEPWIVLPDARLEAPEGRSWEFEEGAPNLLCLRPGATAAATRTFG
ncbi:MAG TPA: FkbM family methyltransferase [Thermoanaerobaculia bacterium]|nr:FkbM family methyltransferase [Thermoanaerobaculia bacterium]